MKCPDCQQGELDPQGVCPKCGAAHESTRPAHYPTVADLDDALVAVVQQGFAKRVPRGMPPAPRDAVRWLIRFLLEAQDRTEAPKQITVGNGKDTRTEWRWPYLERCVYISGKFFALSADDQQYVLAAREDGIPWRGDDMDFFRRVVEEHMRMQEIGAEVYRKEALARMKTMRVGG